MPARKPISLGTSFGRLVIIELPQNPTAHKKALCLCACGEKKLICIFSLTQGRTRSCGCLAKQVARERLVRHGEARRNQFTAEYRCWLHIKDRCGNPKNRSYKYYGQRGIRICERWLKIENFLKDMGRRPEGAYSIDRIRNQDGYDPGNCKWATPKEQSINRRSTLLIEVDGVSKRVFEWAEQFHLTSGAIRQRLKNGWAPKEAVTTPIISLQDRARMAVRARDAKSSITPSETSLTAELF